MINRLREIIKESKIDTDISQLEKKYIKTLSDIKNKLTTRAHSNLIKKEYEKAIECVKAAEEIQREWDKYTNVINKEFTEVEEGVEEVRDEDISDITEDIADEDIADEDIADEDIADEDIADEDTVKQVEKDNSAKVMIKILEDKRNEKEEHNIYEKKGIGNNIFPIEIELRDNKNETRARAKYYENKKVTLVRPTIISLNMEGYMKPHLKDKKQKMIDEKKVIKIVDYYRLDKEETLENLKDAEYIIFGNWTKHEEYKWVLTKSGEELEKYLNKLGVRDR